MKKFKPHSTLLILLSTAFIVAFGGGHFASAQDKSALEVDIFAPSVQIELLTPSGDVALVQLSGPIKQHVYFEGPDEGDADDDDNDGLEEVRTEIVEMDLVGTNPSLGEVRLHVHSIIPSLGQIREQVNNTPGVLDIPPFTPTGMADSFFDVFFRIELPDLGQSFFAAEPKRLIGVITQKPPAPCDSYENHDQTPIIDANGRPAGYFLGKMTLEIECENDCDWNPGEAYKMHWPQLPDLGSTGMDLDISLLNLADDFKCTATGPINDIHIWASFRDDVLPSDGPDGLTFEISIYSDIPAIEGGWSMPGELLWSRTLKPGEYSVRKLNDSLESWYDPAKELYLQDNHTQAYQYNFCIKEDPFVQEEGTIYWLGVKELPRANENYKFGWKTTTRKLRWNDDAVFFLPGNPLSFPLTYPKEHQYKGESLDLAFVITGGEEGQGKHDLGDAPDSSNSFPGASMLAYPSGVVANYPTVYQTGSPPYGPIHWQPDAFIYLGEIVTNESEADIGYDEDIKNNLVPLDDLSDLDGGDDGVQLSLILPPCQEVSFDFMVTFVNPLFDNPAYLNVWFDWNRDGDWDDTMVCPDGVNVPEWAVQNASITNNFAGSVVLTTPKFMCWHPQTDAELDPMWMRITISLQPWETVVGAAVSGGSGPADGYLYGETEDYLIYPKTEPGEIEYDWGDAPEGVVAAGYPTLAVTNGANHVIAGPWLGDKNDRPESELDGQPDPDALGDDNAVKDDENGVSIPMLIPGQPVNLTLEVSGGGGVVQAWIDFNSDMTWQPSEKIYDGFLPAGIYTIPVFVPDSTMVGRTFARFRISKQGGLGPEGPAPDGEVEDHEVFVESIPQATSRPGSATQCPVVATQCPTVATQCPVVQTQCPAVATQCPPANTQCPVVATQCPAVQTQCVAITMCPPVNTTCPVAQTQCPAVATQCPPANTQCPVVATHCPAVQTQCVAVTMCPPVNTTCPVAQTQCPAVETQCPPVPTKCPAEQTKCPPVQTRCPAVDTECPPLLTSCPPKETECSLVPTMCQGVKTQCPAIETQCPPVNTKCPPVETECPPLETRCPPALSKCPPVPTQCTAVETRCPPRETLCPAIDTECPPLETRCNIEKTKCPPVSTQCPAVDTKCPSEPTKCPPVPTQCPAVVTECRAVETVCPAVTTQCPLVPTQCPITLTMMTQCPAVPTRCPPQDTKCPVVDTQCPPADTKCPGQDTKCPVAQTRCPPEVSKCPPVPTQCTAVNTQCPPTKTQCPTVDTECPISETKCPPVLSKCPPVPTQCTAVNTQCPPMKTQCPVEKTVCPISSTNCPVVQTQCPPVQTQCPAASTVCPPTDTRCPTVSTRCPPVKTQCPVEKTVCPISSTNCPVVQTQCPPVQTQCPPVKTQCPAVSTECPPAETKCPPTVTECQQVRTQCPATLTECPQVQTQCPAVSTVCPPALTRCPPTLTKCPLCVVETILPVKTQCPASQTNCPAVDTKCPPVETECPPVSTQCPPVSTQCPPSFTQCIVMQTICTSCFETIIGCIFNGTKNYTVMAECPAIDVQAPTVIAKPLLAKAR
ncbi:MAG: GEVED domain-containing protein [Sedimentisphaerales bacterium]